MQIDSLTNSGVVVTRSTTSDDKNVDKTGSQQSVPTPPEFPILTERYSKKNTDLIGALYESSLSADMVEVLVALLGAMSASRKARSQQWMADARKSFETALLGVESLRDSADKQFVSSMITNGFSIGQSTLDGAGAAYSLAKTHFGQSEIKAEADKKDFGYKDSPDKNTNVSKLNNNTTTTNDVKNSEPKTDISDRAENQYESIEEIRAKQQANATENLKDSETTGNDKSSTRETTEERQARELANKKATADKERYIAEKNHDLNLDEDRRGRLISAVSSIIGSAGKMGGSSVEQQASLSQADAQALRAFADYMNSIANSDNEWYNELQAQFKAIIQALQSIDSARHQANTQLWS